MARYSPLATDLTAREVPAATRAASDRADARAARNTAARTLPGARGRIRRARCRAIAPLRRGVPWPSRAVGMHHLH